MKKCNGCRVECFEAESFAMRLVKALKKRIFYLSIIVILEFAIILGMLCVGTVSANEYLREEYCILPEISNHFESEEEIRTRSPVKRKCIVAKKKR